MLYLSACAKIGNEFAMSSLEVSVLQTGSSEKLYQLMVNSISSIALVILDTQGNIIGWNPGAEAVIGYKADEIMGKNAACFFTEADRQQNKSEQILQQALSEGRYEDEGWRVRKDGSLFWANIVITPLYDNGTHVGYSQVTRDFSRRREAEEALRETVKELADIKYALDESTIVARTDEHGVITYVNDTFCRISKYEREELIGKTHQIINSGYHPKGFFADMWKTITQGKVWRGEVKNKAKDGTYYWVDTTIVPFITPDGHPYQYIAIRHEITARKRVEAEIRLLNEEMEERIHQRTAELQDANELLSETLRQLQESEKLRSAFISALTHDLRTPLVAQERAVELFLSNRDKLPPKLATLAERLYKSNQGLLDMVNMLLETYQYESGKINLLWETVDLSALVDACFSDVSALAESKQIQLHNQMPSTFASVSGDSHQLKRVFMNIIGNALQNIPSGCQVIVKGEDTENRICITLEDNGPGIPPDSLPHLFERYYVGDHIHKKIGTGLGLYICKMIMEQHHGTISVESDVNKGAKFLLTLPKNELRTDT
jgi:PAS domain S-box-containing protein